MKKYFKIPCALFGLVAMAACAGETVDIDSEYNDNLVGINAIIANGISSRTDAAETGSLWTNGDQIYVVNTTSNAVEDRDKCAFIYSSSTSTWTANAAETLVWANGDLDNTFEAYYPYLLSVKSTSYSTFTIPSDQSSNTPGDENFIGNSDWMIASTTAKRTDNNKSINLRFQHQLARVVMTISYPSSLYESSNFNISNAKFRLPTINMDSRVTSLGDITPYVSGATLTAFLPSGEYNSGNTLLTFTVNGADPYTVKIPSSGFSMEMGKSYICKASITGEGVTISSVMVNDWDSETMDGGYAFQTGGEVQVNGHDIEIYSVEAVIKSLTPIVNTSTNEAISLTFTGTVPSSKESVFWSGLNRVLQSAYVVRSIDMSALTGVKAIPSSEFNGRLAGLFKLESVILPSTIRSIGTSAFENCTSLTTVIIPGETYISSSAFKNSAKLTSVTATKVSGVWDSAFCYCESLTSLSFPAATELGSRVFYGCENLSSISLPKVTSLGSRCFDGTGITSLSLPELTSVVAYTFSGADALATIRLPKANDFKISAFYGFGGGGGTLYLTAAGDINLNYNEASEEYSALPSDSERVDLVLNSDKQVGGTATPTVVYSEIFKKYTWGVNYEGYGVDWKSITYEDN